MSDLVHELLGRDSSSAISWWQMVLRAMRRVNVTEQDLVEALRTSAGTADLGRVREAYLERSGRISFVRR